MRMRCMEEGTPEPIFELRDDETMVCFPMDPDSLLAATISHDDPLSSAPLARTDLPAIQSTARDRAGQQNIGLTLNDEKVLAMIDIDGRLTASRIAKNLNISESTVRRSFRRLRELGLIDRVGRTNGVPAGQITTSPSNASRTFEPENRLPARPDPCGQSMELAASRAS